MTERRTLQSIRIRDPFIYERAPGSFVLFGTTDENVWGGPSTGFDCYTSTDLREWEGPYPAFRPPEGFWGDTQFWAPEVHAHDGLFFLFATFASSVSRVRGVATLVARDPMGPFEPWSDGPLTPQGIPCLDGTLHVDGVGDPWLVYSRGAEGGRDGSPGLPDGEMWAIRLTADLKAAIGAPRLLFRATSAAWSRPLRLPDGALPPPALNLAPDAMFTDGPFVVRAPDGTLLMLWSSYGEEGYAMGVARSESGDVLGPWAQRERPLWARNGGHGMILLADDGTSYLVFHHPNDSPQERVKLVEVELTEDGIVALDVYGEDEHA